MHLPTLLLIGITVVFYFFFTNSASVNIPASVSRCVCFTMLLHYMLRNEISGSKSICIFTLTRGWPIVLQSSGMDVPSHQQLVNVPLLQILENFGWCQKILQCSLQPPWCSTTPHLPRDTWEGLFPGFCDASRYWCLSPLTAFIPVFLGPLYKFLLVLLLSSSWGFGALLIFSFSLIFSLFWWIDAFIDPYNIFILVGFQAGT